MILFPPLKTAILALLCGICFGFLLQKSNVTKSKTIIGQLLMKDFTVMKVMISAVAFGGLLLFLISLKVSFTPIISLTSLVAALSGGLVFGVGVALLGYCPGTCVGAMAAKDSKAFMGFLGMIAGAMIYAPMAPSLHARLKAAHLINQQLLSQYFSIPSWMVLSFPFLFIIILKLADLRKERLSNTIG